MQKNPQEIVFSIPELVREIYKYVREKRDYNIIILFSKVNKNCKKIAYDDACKINIMRHYYSNVVCKLYNWYVSKFYEPHTCETTRQAISKIPTKKYLFDHILNYKGRGKPYCACKFEYYKDNITYVDSWLKLVNIDLLTCIPESNVELIDSN